jgi:hypothetical protein
MRLTRAFGPKPCLFEVTTMKKKSALCAMVLIIGLLLTSSACLVDGEVTVTVNNRGPAALLLTFFTIQTRLETGLTEVYTVTLPGKHATQQVLTWYPLIHPNQVFTELVVLKHGENIVLDLAYDPTNPPE